MTPGIYTTIQILRSTRLFFSYVFIFYPAILVTLNNIYYVTNVTFLTPEKMYYSCHKNIKQHNCFHVTLKTSNFNIHSYIKSPCNINKQNSYFALL